MQDETTTTTGGRADEPRKGFPLRYTAEWAYVSLAEVQAVLTGQRRWACMLTRAERIDAQMADMVAQGYHVHSVRVSAHCATCAGTGRVHDRRYRAASMRWITCKVCKGHPEVWDRPATRGDDLRDEI
jgi:hypothetical protein